LTDLVEHREAGGEVLAVRRQRVAGVELEGEEQHLVLAVDRATDPPRGCEPVTEKTIDQPIAS